MANALTNFFKRGINILGEGNTSLSSWLSGLFMASDSKTVTENTVLTITPAWRAIYIIKDILSTMPLNLYQRTADGDVVIATDHPLNKLLSQKPHPLYTPFEWMSAMIVNACVAGNGISVVHRHATGVPKALEIKPFDKLRDIQLVMDDSPHLLFFFHDELKAFHSDDVIQFMGLSTNGVAGLNTTRVHKETLSSEAAMRDYIKSFLENGAFLSGVIEHPTVLSDQAYKRAKTSWDDAFSGAKKAGKTAFLEGGAQYKRIQATVPETGYEIVKGASISDISRIYGVPEYMLDAKNKPTYASIEHISLDFKKYTIDGWCTKIEQELTRKLVSSNQAGTYFFAYDKSGLTTGDMATMGEYYTKLFNMGWINRNEGRRFLKMNKVEDGDRYYIQGNNMVPVDAVDKLIELKQSGNNQGKAATDVKTLKEE